MAEQRAVLYTAAGLGRGRVGATIETMPGLDRPDVSDRALCNSCVTIVVFLVSVLAAC
jgi:hypothetical protein